MVDPLDNHTTSRNYRGDVQDERTYEDPGSRVVGDEGEVDGSSVSGYDDGITTNGVRSVESMRRVDLLVGGRDVGGNTGDLELVTVQMD